MSSAFSLINLPIKKNVQSDKPSLACMHHRYILFVGSLCPPFVFTFSVFLFFVFGVFVLFFYSHIQRIALATEETTVTQRVSLIGLSNANAARGHKEVRKSTGHIMVVIRYADRSPR